MRGFVICLSLIPSFTTPAIAQTQVRTKTPIQHFVVLMEEGRSFDSFFGTYPGAEGVPAEACVPVSPALNECTKPYIPDDRTVRKLDKAARRHSGFFTLAHYTDKHVPYYWNMADQFVLFDHYFSSANASVNTPIRNKLYAMAAAPGRATKLSPQGYGNLRMIFDRLEARGISWKFYVQDYNPNITYHDIVRGQALPKQVVKVPLLNYERFVNDPKLMRHIVDLSEYYKDLAQGTLPAVSYIVANGASEPTPKGLTEGQLHLKVISQELMRSSAWNRSALLWTHDQPGGWYDHMVPPRVDDLGLGLRVPAMLISPYALRGKVDSTVLEHSSILKFIEHNWGLRPLTQRDANANNLLSAFNFDQPPRSAEFLPMTRTKAAAARREPVRMWIYLFYGAALAIAVALFGRVLWVMLRGDSGEFNSAQPTTPTAVRLKP
jgi:phospholipase C